MAVDLELTQQSAPWEGYYDQAHCVFVCLGLLWPGGAAFVQPRLLLEHLRLAARQDCDFVRVLCVHVWWASL